MISVITKKLLTLAIGIVLSVVAGLYLAFGGWEKWFGGPSVSSIITLYGNIDIREANPGFNISGRVTSMHKEEGDRVARGDLLASLDSSTYAASVAEGKAKLAEAQASLNRLLAGSRPEEINKVRFDVKALETQIGVAKLDLERTKKLLTESWASQQKYDENLAALRNLEAKHNAAKQVLSLAVQGPRQEDIDFARANLEAARAGLTLAQARLGFTLLKASESGTIMTRLVEPGNVVLANSPIYAIALDKPLWVRTYVSAPQLGRVSPGQKATIRSDSWPDVKFEGRVGFISPISEFTPKSVETTEVRTSLVYRLRIYLENPGNRLRQGMPVTVHLQPEIQSKDTSGDIQRHGDGHNLWALRRGERNPREPGRTGIAGGVETAK
jgi:HlyD family secretion protein